MRADRGRLAALLLLTLAAAGCVRAARPVVAPPDPARLAALAPRLGQLVLVGFTGTAPAPDGDVDRLLCADRVGGVVLFARNIVDAGQLRALTGWMAARARACGDDRLLVAVDAEGGRVMRLGPQAGFTPTPSAAELGDANDVTLTELEARRVGALLREAGINWNLAPVVDVGYNPANTVIAGAGRAFGADPVRVTAQARAWIAGMHAEGVRTALKHFPGHGSSFADSHQGFVDVTDTANPALELSPYRALIADGVVDAIMTAHVFNRALDPRYPATLSTATIDGLLRGRLRFTGVVVSDDMRMGAIEQHYGMDQAAVLALTAGVDMVLIAQDRLPDGGSATALALAAVRRALADGRLPLARVEHALARVRALKRALPS